MVHGEEVRSSEFRVAVCDMFLRLEYLTFALDTKKEKDIHKSSSKQ